MQAVAQAPVERNLLPPQTELPPEGPPLDPPDLLDVVATRMLNAERDLAYWRDNRERFDALLGKYRAAFLESQILKQATSNLRGNVDAEEQLVERERQLEEYQRTIQVTYIVLMRLGLNTKDNNLCRGELIPDVQTAHTTARTEISALEDAIQGVSIPLSRVILEIKRQLPAQPQHA